MKKKIPDSKWRRDNFLLRHRSASGNRFIFFWLLFLYIPLHAQVGKRYPPEKKQYKDSITGRTVIALTTHPASDTKIYQTHPQWTSDGQYRQASQPLNNQTIKPLTTHNSR